jgi:hypothetical protein
MSKTRTKQAGSMHLKQAYILSKQWGDPRITRGESFPPTPKKSTFTLVDPTKHKKKK